MTAARTRLRAALALLALAMLIGGVVAAGGQPAGAATGEASVRSFFVSVSDSPGSAARIRLDASLFTPAQTPAPAVLLAHGFGQDKSALASQARHLQQQGYVVLTYSARGFGRSGGLIGLDSLDGEVPDARAMIDVLDRDPRVLRRSGDPAIAVVGGSYGGALALMAGATDPRVDTVVAAITWNDLADALAPPSAGTGVSGERDLKVGWASRLFGAGIAGEDAPCGRFTPRFCDLYRRLVSGSPATAADLALLARSSPATVLGGMRAPTLLLQGEQDRLFGLDQADANVRQLRAAGAPVEVRWFDGGHDGGGTAGTEGVLDAWLRDHLRSHHAVSPHFVFDIPATAASFQEQLTAARYGGLNGSGTRLVLAGPATTVINPPSGLPASVTGIPGLDGTTSVDATATRLFAASNPPQEAATFVSAPLTAPALLVGTPRVRVRVVPTAGTTGGTAVLYAQLVVRSGDAERALPGGVAPIRVDLPLAGATLDVALPATAWNLAPGDRVALTLRTSDTQFLGSTTPAAYRVSVAGALDLPTTPVIAADRSAGYPTAGVIIGIVATLVLGLLLLAFAVLRSRRAAPRTPEDEQEQAPPLAIAGLTKRFRSGFVAVDDVSFVAERGQVVGLLGENGAGKTTTLRMATGLIRADAGEVRLFGAPVTPGAPQLARLGCFIEGPGFLPQLSGRRNLQLYWAATGRRRGDAHLADVLAIADLGRAIEKPVRGYSQGMRQRLAIAQAMLGLPELLVLDEPTNGLDPPQISALRTVLRQYAASGRTVVVSSHLLAEVERTCSHVVVMSHGRVVAAGSVAEIAGEEDELLVTVTDVPVALDALGHAGFPGATVAEGNGVRVRLGDRGADHAVAVLVAAGVGVLGLSRGRRLEEAFLDLIGTTEPSA